MCVCLYVCLCVCMYAVVYPGLLRGGVYMASDSEPTKGFGDLLPMVSKGKAYVGGMGDEVPQKEKHFYAKYEIFCISCFSKWLN